MLFISVEFLKSFKWLRNSRDLLRLTKNCVFSFSLKFTLITREKAASIAETGWRTFQSINEWMIYATFDVDTAAGTGEKWKCSFSCFACTIASVVSRRTAFLGHFRVELLTYVRLERAHILITWLSCTENEIRPFWWKQNDQAIEGSVGKPWTSICSSHQLSGIWLPFNGNSVSHLMESHGCPSFQRKSLAFQQFCRTKRPLFRGLPTERTFPRSQNAGRS